jgi:hypothetical protein
MNKKRSDQEHREAAKHVDYEIHMANGMALWLSSHIGTPSMGGDVWKACLESFVLHVRNLIDFLYPPGKPQDDDILSDDYVSDVTKWNGSRPGMTPLLKETKPRVNKLAAHLTYNRLVSPKNWKVGAIWADLEKVLICFLNHLPPGWAAWFPSARALGPTGSTGTPSPAVGEGATGPAGPTGSGEATTRG